MTVTQFKLKLDAAYDETNLEQQTLLANCLDEEWLQANYPEIPNSGLKIKAVEILDGQIYVTADVPVNFGMPKEGLWS
jgi:hypothetical protein